MFERALAAVERVGDDFGIALALINLASAHLGAGELAEVRDVIGRILRHMRTAGITYAGDDLLDILARIEHVDGEDERAIELLTGAESLREGFRTSLWPPMLERHERLMRELREAVGDDSFAAAYERGRARDVTDLQDAAMRFSGPA